MQQMLLRWKELSPFCCLAYMYVVHVSLPCNTCKVLRMQALYTPIFVFTVNLRFDHTRDVGRVSVVAAFLTLLLISVSRERLLVIVDPRYTNW